MKFLSFGVVLTLFIAPEWKGEYKNTKGSIVDDTDCIRNIWGRLRSIPWNLSRRTASTAGSRDTKESEIKTTCLSIRLNLTNPGGRRVSGVWLVVTSGCPQRLPTGRYPPGGVGPQSLHAPPQHYPLQWNRVTLARSCEATPTLARATQREGGGTHHSAHLAVHAQAAGAGPGGHQHRRDRPHRAVRPVVPSRRLP